MHLITSLLLLLTSARLFGRLFKTLGFQEIIGEILGGLLVGLTSLIVPTKELSGIVDLAIFLLIFSAGLEMNLQDVFSSLRRKAIVCAFTGFSISFSMGILCGFFLDLSLVASLVIGLCFAISALPVVLSFLNNLKIVTSQVAHLTVGSAVLIDILSLLILGIIFDTEYSSGVEEYVLVFFSKVLKMAVFFVAVMLVNKFLRFEISRAKETETLFNKSIAFFGKEAVFGVGVFFVLGFSTLSENLGFHFIIGAFFGGLLLNKDIIGTTAFLSMTNTLGAVTNHFLTPVFFAYIGLHFSIETLTHWDVLSVVTLMAFLSKIGGVWLGAKFSALSHKESLKMGIILNSRGGLDLIIANMARQKGYLNEEMFSVLICLSVLSVIFNPVLYRRFVEYKPIKTKPASKKTEEDASVSSPL